MEAVRQKPAASQTQMMGAAQIGTPGVSLPDRSA
jgi:hypothetical protein